MKKCSLCKTEKPLLEFPKNCNTIIRQALAIDKLVPKLGYIIGNMVLACTVCNSIKSDFLDEKEMFEIAEKYIKPKLNTYGTK